MQKLAEGATTMVLAMTTRIKAVGHRTTITGELLGLYKHLIRLQQTIGHCFRTTRCCRSTISAFRSVGDLTSTHNGQATMITVIIDLAETSTFAELRSHKRTGPCLSSYVGDLE